MYGDELVDELYALAEEGESRRRQVVAALCQLFSARHLRAIARAGRTSVISAGE
jgi:hypothetical protein